MELSALETLVAVADEGSLSAAARALGLAQPNVSRSIATLERRLGLVLLRRTTTGSVPTPEGLLVVAWAREVLASADALVRDAATLRDAAEVTLHVVASQTVAEHLLPRWLATLRRRNPGVRVQVEVTNTAGVLAALHNGRAGIGFVEGPVPRGSVHLAPVGHDELVLVCAPELAWAGRARPVGRDDILTDVLVTREAGSGTRGVLDAVLGAPVAPRLELGSNAAVRVAVEAGAGPAVLSRLAVADALACGALVEVPLAVGGLARPLQAAWTGPQHLAGAPGALLAIAREAPAR